MSILNLGKVRPVLLGAYSEATEYKFLNGVSYNGSYYFYINETASTGNLPTDTEYWAIAAQKGDKGETGTIYTPAISEDGVLSFTNNGELDNPTPVDLTGPQGDPAPDTTLQYKALNSSTWVGTVPELCQFMRLSADGGTTWSDPIEFPGVAALALKAPLSSPAFTNTPTAPTAEVGTNTTQIANTAFVENSIREGDPV